jgi:hypothetical protein
LQCLFFVAKMWNFVPKKAAYVFEKKKNLKQTLVRLGWWANT